MGIMRMRAICPNCGGKIHTQAKGLGHFTWMANGPLLVKTGTTCQFCGIALTGKVDMQNRAILAHAQSHSMNSQTSSQPEPRVVSRSKDENGTERITLSNGESLVTAPDGTKTLRNAHGLVLVVRPDGTQTTSTSNGLAKAAEAGGPTTLRTVDGSVIVTARDGTKTTTSAAGLVIVRAPDGTTTITRPDGSVTVRAPNGTTTSR